MTSGIPPVSALFPSTSCVSRFPPNASLGKVPDSKLSLKSIPETFEFCPSNEAGTVPVRELLFALKKRSELCNTASPKRARVPLSELSEKSRVTAFVSRDANAGGIGPVKPLALALKKSRFERNGAVKVGNDPVSELSLSATSTDRVPSKQSAFSGNEPRAPVFLRRTLARVDKRAQNAAHTSLVNVFGETFSPVPANSEPPDSRCKCVALFGSAAKRAASVALGVTGAVGNLPTSAAPVVRCGLSSISIRVTDGNT